MERCIICGSKEYCRKKYNNHKETFTIKALIKEIAPYFDPIIPKSFRKLKRISSINKKERIFNGNIMICNNCGHGIMEFPPTNSELYAYYKQQYWGKRTSDLMNITDKHNQYQTDQRACSQISFYVNKVNPCSIINVLEIGAGAANASLLLRNTLNENYSNNDCKIYVCEPSTQWEDYYIKQGIEKIADYFPFNINFNKPNKFDLIHTSHWLEHVLDLDSTLLELYERTEPEGFVFVEVPNTEHYYWDLPLKDVPHIQFFTRKSLITIFEKYGYKCLGSGEYGITYLDSYNGVKLKNINYNDLCNKGFWIRAIFQKTKK